MANSLSLPLRLAIAVVGSVAVLVNTFVLVLVVSMKASMYRLSYQLVAVISIVDLISGLNALVGFGVMHAMGVQEAFNNPFYCPVFGFVGNMSIIVSGMLMAALAFERYSLVCQEKILKTPSTFRVLGLITLMFFIPSVATSITRGFQPDPLEAYCNLTNTGWAAVNSAMITPTYIVPLLILIFCYISILLRVMHSAPDLDICKRKVAIKLFLFISLYSVCFLPKFIGIVWSSLYSVGLPDFLNLFAPIGINLLNIANPILILFLHNQFKTEALELLSFSSYRAQHSFPEILP